VAVRGFSPLVLPATSLPLPSGACVLNSRKLLMVTRQNARNWIVTQHDLEAFWRADFQEHYAFQYMVYQVEECPKTHSWHVQAFIQFKCCVRGSTVQRLMGGSAPHIEVAHHPSEARDYCMKEATRLTPPVEYGEWRPEFTKGYRTDISVAKQVIRHHGNFRRCLDDDSLDTITARYPKWVTEQLTMVSRPLRKPPVVTVYYGPTLTGKTLRCHQLNPGIHELRYDNGFMNYSGQSCVLFDEFDKAPWPFGLMLKLLDRYPFQVNVKNGYVWWEATHIFITATDAPEDWYLGKNVPMDHIPQFTRRLTTVINTAGSVFPASPDISEITCNSPEITETNVEVTAEVLDTVSMEIDADDDSQTVTVDPPEDPPIINTMNFPELTSEPSEVIKGKEHSRTSGMTFKEMLEFLELSDDQ